MKLWLREENWPWSPEKYRFPAEQMLLTLFPGQRPEYPESLSPEEDGVTITLRRGPELAQVSALVRLGARQGRGEAGFPAQELDRQWEQVYHTLSHEIGRAHV